MVSREQSQKMNPKSNLSERERGGSSQNFTQSKFYFSRYFPSPFHVKFQICWHKIRDAYYHKNFFM